MCARFDFCACVWVHSRKLYKLSFAVRNAKLCLWVKGPLKHDAQKSWPINWNFVVTLRFDIYFSSLYNGKYTFLGLLAKIKCSICSYQFNIWYTGNAQYSILNEFFWGATTELCLHSGSKDGRGQAQCRRRPPLSYSTRISSKSDFRSSDQLSFIAWEQTATSSPAHYEAILDFKRVGHTVITV